MSRARNIPEDLHHVAQLAGTTAVVVEGAAVAADRAQHAAEVAAEVKEQVSRASRGRGRKLLLLVVLAGLVVIGVAVWRKRSAEPEHDAEVTDIRDAPEFAGSMP